MKLFMQIVFNLGLLAFAGCCAFGFVASFEPNPPPQQWGWRAGYAILGAASLWSLLRLCRFRGRKSNQSQPHSPAEKLAGIAATQMALFSAIVVMTLAVLFFVGCVPTGQKVLRMEVYQNDQLVLRTVFAAPDSESPAKLWRYASQEPFDSEEEVLRVKPDPGDPLHATLKGTIRINILHTTNLQTTALLTDLKLVRRAADTSKWFLPESEVERATRAMQPVVTSRITLLGLPPSGLVAGLVIVTAIAAFIIGVRHWRTPAGKAATIVSGLTLVVFAIVIFCVLLTVWSGSMG